MLFDVDGIRTRVLGVVNFVISNDSVVDDKYDIGYLIIHFFGKRFDGYYCFIIIYEEFVHNLKEIWAEKSLLGL